MHIIPPPKKKCLNSFPFGLFHFLLFYMWNGFINDHLTLQGYEVYVHDSVTNSTMCLGNTTETFFRINSLLVGHNYTFSVRARCLLNNQLCGEAAVLLYDELGKAAGMSFYILNIFTSISVDICLARHWSWHTFVKFQGQMMPNLSRVNPRTWRQWLFQCCSCCWWVCVEGWWCFISDTVGYSTASPPSLTATTTPVWALPFSPQEMSWVRPAWVLPYMKSLLQCISEKCNLL